MTWLRERWFVWSVLVGIALANYRRRRAERHEPDAHLLDRVNKEWLGVE